MRMLKECTECLERKPTRSAFRKKGDGFQGQCRDCENAIKRESRASRAKTFDDKKEVWKQSILAD